MWDKGREIIAQVPPHLRHASGGAGPGDAGSGIDAGSVPVLSGGRKRNDKLLYLAARAIVSLRTALPFPLLLPLPDHVHTPRNTSAISL